MIRRDAKDAAFSDLVRMRAKWRCEVCGLQPDRQRLHCSHFFGRANRATRWHPENACAKCFKCHERFGRDHIWAASLIIDRLGEDRASEIQELAGTVAKFSKPDLKQIQLDLKAALKAERIDDFCPGPVREHEKQVLGR